MSTTGSLSSKGGYILIMQNKHNMELDIGKLGRVKFEQGYYVYVGSGMGGVYERTKRHSRKDKKKHWHIDYLTPEYMSIKRIYIIRREQRIEELLAQRIEKISYRGVKGFGASDSSLASHLFFFASPPHHMRAFTDIVLDFNAEKVDFH
jgi:sugar fermentation stimulation protein A